MIDGRWLSRLALLEYPPRVPRPAQVHPNLSCGQSYLIGDLISGDIPMTRWFSIGAASFVLAMATVTTADAQWATLKGQFLLERRARFPKPAKIRADKNPGVLWQVRVVRRETGRQRQESRAKECHSLVVDQEPPKAHPDYANTANDVVMMNNRNCRFDPHVVLVRTTQQFQVGNADPIGHNALINFLRNSRSIRWCQAAATPTSIWATLSYSRRPCLAPSTPG